MSCYHTRCSGNSHTMLECITVRSGHHIEFDGWGEAWVISRGSRCWGSGEECSSRERHIYGFMPQTQILLITDIGFESFNQAMTTTCTLLYFRRILSSSENNPSHVLVLERPGQLRCCCCCCCCCFSCGGGGGSSNGGSNGGCSNVRQGAAAVASSSDSRRPKQTPSRGWSCSNIRRINRYKHTWIAIISAQARDLSLWTMQAFRKELSGAGTASVDKNYIIYLWQDPVTW